MTNGPLLGKIVRVRHPPWRCPAFCSCCSTPRTSWWWGQFVGPHRPGGRGLYQRGHQPDRQPCLWAFSVGANVLAAQYYGAGKNQGPVGDGAHRGALQPGLWGGAHLRGRRPVPAYAGVDGHPGGCAGPGGAVHAHLLCGHAGDDALQLRRGHPPGCGGTPSGPCTFCCWPGSST